jgi:hypothetical protein
MISNTPFYAVSCNKPQPIADLFPGNDGKFRSQRMYLSRVASCMLLATGESDAAIDFGL